MATLAVRGKGAVRRLAFAPGQTLFRLLLAAEVPIRCGCSGTGGCGLCLVRVLGGAADPPTPLEALHLDDAQRAAGVRLACQVVPRGDLAVEVLAVAARPAWHYLRRDETVSARVAAPLIPATARHVAKAAGRGAAALARAAAGRLGVAVDLGTSALSLSLFERAIGRWRAGCRGANPQGLFGQDILTRLTAASESPAVAGQLRRAVVEAIGLAIGGLAIRARVPTAAIDAVTLVGNPTMLALLTGDRIARLVDPRQWSRPISCRPADPAAWVRAWGIAGAARIELAAPLAGLIGSDLLAGLIATGLTDTADAGLLIDFGTNTEIALWDGATLWTTSAAGGPAFEGSGLGCGLPAGPGAVDRLAFGDRGPVWHVIGGGPPRGLCATGLVDLIAGLRRTGQLNERGRFAAGVPAAGFALTARGRQVRLSGADVDLFQAAKAAIGAGVGVLLDRAGLAVGALGRVCVGGTFGQGLDIANAQSIGLLPPVPAARVELCGNTALAGAGALLLAPEPAVRLAALRARARVVNLAQTPDFEERFLDQLFLRPPVLRTPAEDAP